MSWCTIEGCSRKQHGRGLCDMHIKRELRLKLPEYGAWQEMRRRCYKPAWKQFADYGGRGIKVCERWKNSFSAFFEDMGRRPLNTSLDRIDVNGNYEPNNCRWATKLEQNNNRRDTVKLTYAGRSLSFSQWASELGISRNIIRDRYYRKWSIERIFNQGVRNGTAPTR